MGTAAHRRRSVVTLTGFLFSLTTPPGCMLSPVYPAAVVAGNVEISQNITDTLFAALGKLAACQVLSHENSGPSPPYRLPY